MIMTTTRKAAEPESPLEFAETGLNTKRARKIRHRFSVEIILADQSLFGWSLV